MRPVPSALCLGLIHQFEGHAGAFEPARTQDPAGNWEIGWSHKLCGPEDPLWDQTLSATAADTLALMDLSDAAQELCGDIPDLFGQLTDGQYAALIDFVYNEGIGQFHNSTLHKLLLTGLLSEVPDQLSRWIFGTVNGDKVVLPGLVRRRNAEIALWNS